jgi:hypothetical protein
MSTNYDTQTLEVSYNGTTWSFTKEGESEGSNPTLTFKKPTYLYFVAVGNSLTFNASNPVTWDQGKKPKDSTTNVINDGCLRIIDPDSEKKKAQFSCILNMSYNGTAVSTSDPVIINKPNT